MNEQPIMVVGWDGSDNAEHAVRVAADMCTRLRGKLRVLLVWDYLTQPYTRRNDYDHHSALDDVDNFVTRLDLAVPVVAAERLGIAHEAITDYAAESAADIIVIGRSGKGGVLNHVFGSTTSHVIRHAACPVFVVPQVAQAAPSASVTG